MLTGACLPLVLKATISPASCTIMGMCGDRCSDTCAWWFTVTGGMSIGGSSSLLGPGLCEHEVRVVIMGGAWVPVASACGMAAVVELPSCKCDRY